MDIETTAKELLRLVDRSGVDQGEVYIETSTGLEMEVRDQAVERLKTQQTGGFALRLIADRRMAVVRSSDLRQEALEKTVAKGVELARMAAPDEANSLAQPAEGPDDVGVFDESFDQIPFERKAGFLKDTETLAFACDPLVRRMEGISYWDSKARVVVANTNGVLKTKRSTAFGVNCSVIAEKDGDVETGGEEVTSRFFDRLEPPSKIASRACWKATSMLGGKAIASQTAPVILDRDAAWALLAHLAAMVNGKSVAMGVSVLKDRIGDAIAAPAVTVVDDAVMAGGVASAPFDDEGTPCSRKVLVDRGVLKGFLFDVRSAVKAGAKSTGNGLRGGFRELPEVRSTNLYLAGGGSKPEDIVKSTARGLWVVSLTGWWMGISASTGDFSSGARGFWVENGEIAFPVKNVTVAANLLDILKRVDAVGDDLVFNERTTAPTLRVAEMSVGGT
ncbi:MAG: TldD/PmbA family protein [bacterium]